MSLKAGFLSAFYNRLGEANELLLQMNRMHKGVKVKSEVNHHALRQGFGITTFLRMVLESQPDEDLVAIPFEEPVLLDLCLTWKRGGYLSHADRAFVDYILEQTWGDPSVERSSN
jgi:DNA-binding transcriptional LysR family regulator